jgi:hypothetical protein
VLLKVKERNDSKFERTRAVFFARRAKFCAGRARCPEWWTPGADDRTMVHGGTIDPWHTGGFLREGRDALRVAARRFRADGPASGMGRQTAFISAFVIR